MMKSMEEMENELRKLHEELMSSKTTFRHVTVTYGVFLVLISIIMTMKYSEVISAYQTTMTMYMESMELLKNTLQCLLQ